MIKSNVFNFKENKNIQTYHVSDNVGWKFWLYKMSKEQQYLQNELKGNLINELLF